MEKIKLEQIEQNGEYEVVQQVVPVDRKIAYAKLIAEDVCDEMDNGIGVIDEVMKELNTRLYGVVLYTNIELVDVTLDVYDKLNQYGVFNQIEEVSQDYKDFVRIVNAACVNKEKEYSLQSIAAERMKDSFELLQDFGDHINMILDRVDPNLLTKYLSKGVTMFAKKMPDFSKMEKFDMNKVKKELM